MILRYFINVVLWIAILILTHCVLGIYLAGPFIVNCSLEFFLNYISVLHRIRTSTFVTLISFKFPSCVAIYRSHYQVFAVFIRWVDYMAWGLLHWGGKTPLCSLSTQHSTQDFWSPKQLSASVLMLFSWRQHRIHALRTQVLWDYFPHPCLWFRCQSQVVGPLVPHNWCPTCPQIRDAQDLFLRVAQEFRKTVYLPDSQFAMEGYKKDMIE